MSYRKSKNMMAMLLGFAFVAGCMSSGQEMSDNAEPKEREVESEEREPVVAAEQMERGAAPAKKRVVAKSAPAPEPVREGEAKAKKEMPSTASQPAGAKLADESVGAEAPRQRSRTRDNRRRRVKRKNDHDRVRPTESNREKYTNPGVNEMKETSEDAKSTFAIDVDTGSYTIARRKLNSGRIPPAASVRVEEFVNYFDYDYPQPDSGPFGVNMEAAPSPFAADSNRYLMRVGVQGKRVTRATRKPVHLTFLVDVSGSMSSPDKLGLAKRSLKVLTNNMHEGDTVALATYAGRTAKILDPTNVNKKRRIFRALKRLKAGGSTAMNSGLEIAYKLALENYEPDHVNRVIVLSDGDANVGPSSHNQIQKRIRHFVDEGVTLSTIGFGMGNYQDTMMEQLANNGNGNYYYIDSMDEAKKVFGEQVDGTLQVIAKDVKIQVEFDEDTVPKYRLIGYENRNIKDKNFRNDRVDAGEIGAGHTVTAVYEIEVDPSAESKLATVRVRHKEPTGTKAKEQAFGFHAEELRSKLSDASSDFQFAAAVTGFAEILRESPYAENLSLDLVEEVASSAAGNDADRKEFVGLVKKAKQLRR